MTDNQEWCIMLPARAANTKDCGGKEMIRNIVFDMGKVLVGYDGMRVRSEEHTSELQSH